MRYFAGKALLALGAAIFLALPLRAGAQGPCGADDPGKTVRVTSLEALRAALHTACPGTRVLIRPGHYAGRIIVGPRTAGTAERPIVVTAEQGLGSVTIDGAGATITWKFSGASFVHLKGLQITGGGYHGIFLDQGANNILVENNRIFDNHRTRPLNSHAEIKGSRGGRAPWNVVLRGNKIFHATHPPGSNFQGIDCNFCRGFQVLGNHIHDIKQPTAFEHSYYDRGSCIQFKSASEDILIAGNRIERCNIGVVLGGEGLASPENISGVVRDNTIDQSAEIGLAVINARGFRIEGNRVTGPGISILLAKDRNYPEARSSGWIEDNLLSSPVQGAEAHDAHLRGNRVLPAR